MGVTYIANYSEYEEAAQCPALPSLLSPQTRPKQCTAQLEHGYGHRYNSKNLLTQSPTGFPESKSVYWKSSECKKDDLSLEKQDSVVLTHRRAQNLGCGLGLTSATAEPCDLEQVTEPHGVSMLTSVKWDHISVSWVLVRTHCGWCMESIQSHARHTVNTQLTWFEEVCSHTQNENDAFRVKSFIIFWNDFSEAFISNYLLEGLTWSWRSNTLASWCKELTHWKRSWFWERMRSGEGSSRGWDV